MYGIEFTRDRKNRIISFDRQLARNFGAEERKIIQDKIAKLVKRPDSFGYHGDNEELFKTWTLGPIIEHRDSTLLDQSNAQEIKKRFAALIESGKAEIVSCSHWLVGYVDHLSFPVVEYIQVLHTRVPRTSATYALYQDIERELANYPVLNEDDYSEREFNATLENIENEARYMAQGYNLILPENYVNTLENWFSENEPDALENKDDLGGYPDGNQLKRAFIALDWVVEK